MSLSLLTQSLGIPDGISGWQVLQKQSIGSFTQFSSDPVLKSQIAYFTANIGKVASVDDFLKDPRLQDVAYTAYGLSAQIGANGLMKQVLTSNLASSSSVANRLTTPGYKQLAAALNFGASGTPAVPATASSARTTVDGLSADNTFSSFSGTFGGISLSNVDLSGATTPDQVAAALTKAFQSADNGSSNITVKTVGFDLVFSDAAGRGTASNLTWNTTASDSAPPTMTAARELETGKPAVAPTGSYATPTAAVAATASSARMTVDGVDSGDTFLNFSGTFGGTSVNFVDLSGATTPDQVATALTKAFQAADNGSSNITVKTVGFDLVFTDAAGRGSASNFTWTPSASSSTPPTASAPREMVTGNVAVAATGTSTNAIQTIIAKYTQAKFDEVVGGTSTTLATALYAQQNLSSVTNWYSVIANTKLATVVETALNLPTGFQKLDVDQQNSILSSKMNIADFKDSTKLGKLLDKYVAIASLTDTSSSDASTSGAAYQILSGVSDSLSSDSYGALLTST